MKRLAIMIVCLTGMQVFAQVGVGTVTPHSSAQLDISSSNKGFLPPRMSTSERNAITNPSPGLIIFNTTTLSLELYTGMGWAGITISQPGVRKLIGGSNTDDGTSLEQTSDGGYILGGYSRSSNTGSLSGYTNNGDYDFWIVKLNSNTGIEWQQLIGGTGTDVAQGIGNTNDGGYIIAGSSTSSNTGTLTGLSNNGGTDSWIVKLDAGGSIEWQRLLGGNGTDYSNSIRQTNDGGYIVAGVSASSNNGTLSGIFSNGTEDFWIIKLDGSGNIQWQKLFGGTSIEYAYDARETSDGGYIVTGRSASSNNGTLTGVFGNGLEDILVIKLDNAGNILWQKLIGGSALDAGYRVHEIQDGGGYIVAGFSQSSNTGTLAGIMNNGSNDVIVARLNTIGDIVWQKLLGGSSGDGAYNIETTADNGFIIAAFSASSNTGTLTGFTNNGGNDFWILKLDAVGNIQWQKLLGGSLADEASDIHPCIDGGFVILGRCSSSNTGWLSGYMNNGNSDYWILKLDRYGNVY